MYEMRGAAADMAAAAPAPKVGTLGTVNGLYRYGLDSAFTLPASSTYTLPFLTPKLSTFERYASLSTYFTTQKSEGTLNRSYRLKADQNLPGGQLTVREDGRISGQTTINETAKGEEVEFSLGATPTSATPARCRRSAPPRTAAATKSPTSLRAAKTARCGPRSASRSAGAKSALTA